MQDLENETGKKKSSSGEMCLNTVKCCVRRKAFAMTFAESLSENMMVI